MVQSNPILVIFKIGLLLVNAFPFIISSLWVDYWEFPSILSRKNGKKLTH